MFTYRNCMQAAACAVILLAQPGAASAEKSIDSMENIVVTATRVGMAADDVLAPLLVITREEIERSGALDVAQILRFNAGFDIGRNGGPGQTTSLFLRGTESNHTLVLVDGVRINPGTIGGAAIQNLSPSLIERIEVVKGPRSTLYGTEAIGGVVNIITRSSAAGATAFDASMTAGDYDTGSMAATGSINGDAGSLGLSLSHFDTGGFPTMSGSSISRGHRNTSATVQGATRIGAIDLDVRHWQAQGEAEYLDFFGAATQQDFANSATSLALVADPAANWSSRLAYSFAVDDNEQTSSPDQVRTRRQVVDWQNTIDVGTAQTLIAGASLTIEQVDALVFGQATDETTRTAEVFAADIIDLGPHQFMLAARYTDHETFGSVVNGNIEYGIEFSDATRFTAGAGTGYRAPDATDLYGFGGNAELEPETSTNIEVGLRHRLSANQTVTLGAFSNSIDDLIEYNFDPVTFAGENQNIAKARIDGVELGYKITAQQWTLRSAAIWQDPRNEASGEVLPRRAKRSVTASVYREFLDRYSLGMDVLATDKRKDSGFSDVVNAGYVLANLTASVNITEHWHLQGRVENLLDADYQTAAGFNTPGRGVYLTLRYRN